MHKRQKTLIAAMSAGFDPLHEGNGRRISESEESVIEQ